MALIKEMKLKTGVSATYWLVTITDIKWAGKQLSILVSGFLNKEHCVSCGGDPGCALDFEKRSWSCEDFPLDKTAPNTVGQIYEKLKESVMVEKDGMNPTSEMVEDNFFVDAVDDF